MIGRTLPSNPDPRRMRRWRTRLAVVVFATAVALPGVVHAYSLDELVAMPFERLLQLPVTPRRVAAPDSAMSQAAPVQPRRPH